MWINIIGAGKVGQTLMRLIAASDGYPLGSVAARRFETSADAVKAIGAGKAVASLAEMEHADLWFLTVPDDMISTVAIALSDAGAAPSIAVHCSGFSSSSVLAPLAEKGWRTASFHPVKSFADPQVAAGSFIGTHCAIEGQEEAVAVLWSLCETLGAIPFHVDPTKKALYHAAAVFSNNFSTLLQGIALEAYAASGVPHDIAKALCRTLLEGAAVNVARLGPQAALTGPAARGDHAVLAAQGAEVAAWSKDAGELYEVASRMALRLKSEGRAS